MITRADLRNVVTNATVAVYDEKTQVPSFFRSFFKENFNFTKLVNFEVRRATEKVAVDIVRGERGNFNKMTRSTLKTIEPPLYSEWIRANDHDLYDVAIGSQDPSVMAMVARGLANELDGIRQKIDRAIEIQCVQALMDGVVQLSSSESIDYKRNPASKVDLSGTPWSDNANDPRVDIKNGLDWMRANGKVPVGQANMILGGDAYSAFESNANIINKADLKDYDITMIQEPQRNAAGGVFHGTISAGPYKVNIWTYPEVYTDEAGATKYYMDPKAMLLLPLNTNYNLEFAAVPQLPENGMMPQTDKYLTQEFFDSEKVSHKIYLKTAPIAMPVAIDTMYTAQVLA
jgi:hypothetical protein